MTDGQQTVDTITTSGAVRGFWRGGSAAFLGIPFAAAPVGELRFAAPVRHAPWDGVRDATRYGATPQRRPLAEVTLIPEPSYPGPSTLNVNVFTPDPSTAARLPVLVYIHSGGYTGGSPSSPWYHGDAFNRDGVVTVSVSYRLGFDGFGWIDDAPANRAVLDWLLALQWVQDNIAPFGGDPARVTIAGQSAGGAAVVTLLTSPRAGDLFAQAYSISGVDAVLPASRARAIASRMAALAGVPTTRAGFATLPEEAILSLQDKVTAFGAPPAEGENGGDGTESTSGPLAGPAAMLRDGLPFAPVVDGDLVTDPVAGPVAVFAPGGPAGRPLLIGATDDEFSMATAQFGAALAAVPALTALAAVGLDGVRREAYLAANAPDRPTGQVLGRYVSDAMFRAPALRLARAHRANPTYLYRFSWPSPVFSAAVHCLDLPFVFDCLGAEHVEALAGRHPPQQLADEVHAAAVAFTTTGNPGWRRFDSDEAAMVWDTPSRVVENAYATVEPLLA